MAAFKRNGCVPPITFNHSIKSQRTTNDTNSKLINGNVNQPSNGYTKIAQQSNGVTKMSRGKSNEAPWIDWSKEETYSGSFEKSSLLTAALTHAGLYILMFLGFINQLFFKPKVATERNREGYAPLYNPFEQFFSRYLYRRVRHCFNLPVTSTPAAEVTLKERATDDYNWTFRFTGEEKTYINLGSYNYLGFAEPRGECADAAEEAAKRYGLALASSRAELGTCNLHRELEKTTADFLGVEDAIVFGMGFATNSMGVPGLIGEGSLVISDENNHASLILGLRLARVTVRVFKHNDMKHLETLVRRAIVEGKWKRIVVVVEGVYSMEGSLVPLRALVALKKRYGLYLYLDEAHSVGAMGPRGRGVTDYSGVDPRDIDILMGTFTKSFGAAGGYIAGSRRLIDSVRARGHGHTYAHSMSPPVAAQVVAAMRAIASPAGAARVAVLRDNTRYFREKLRSLGVITFGHIDSPVVPMLVYTFSKMAATVERLQERRVATVGVGFPATPLNKARIRFCLSAAHNRAQLDECLAAIEAVADEIGLRYSRKA
ncbi:serine palmitoyltransferase 2 isoform X1 [Pieris brassicae]|uniref:serine C-palmitoyltransferase n=2 Tax=Pieris brassicae TaxID=7116 RepID=A0A9P0U1K1_PIEBR|nr:serine palmitoyltransferase 2 isoform X1 [Pieris brassicae]CAH4037596.1 unnamed protein product [Pieris brassicae]